MQIGMGSLIAFLKNVLFHPQVGPSKIFQLINSSVYLSYTLQQGSFVGFVYAAQKGLAQTSSGMCQSDIEHLLLYP